MTSSGGLDPEFVCIDCEFGGLCPPASTSVEQSHNFFSYLGLAVLIFFSPHQQPNGEICETVLKLD